MMEKVPGTLTAQVRGILLRRYPRYDLLALGERVLLAMSVLARDLGVREKRSNRGPAVEEILASVGLDEGHPWCAAAISFAFGIAGSTQGPSVGRAAVRQWRAWARESGRLRKGPLRGRLAFRVQSIGAGHIAVVAGVESDGHVRTYEGNTSSGVTGSQRDGDGAYERTRPASFWHGYIELDERA